jgi:hypothetical protein
VRSNRRTAGRTPFRPRREAIYETSHDGLHWALVNQSDFRRSPRKKVGSGLPVYGYVDGIEMTASGRGWLWESRDWT